MSRKIPEKILRVGVVHEGRIIEERLLRKPGDVTVGASPKCTFILPIAKLPDSYRLFAHKKRGRYSLRFTRAMVGKVSVGDSIMELKAVWQSNLGSRDGEYYRLPLDENTRGKLVFGEVSLLFQFVVPPPPVPKLELPATAKGGLLSRIDATLSIAMMISLVLQLGGIGGIQFWWQTSGQFQVKVKKDYLEAYDMLKTEVERRQPLERDVAMEGEGEGEDDENAEEAVDKPLKKHRRAAPVKTVSDEERYKRKLAKVRNTTILRHLGGQGEGAGTITGTGVESGATANRLKGAWNTNGVRVANQGDSPSGFHAGRAGGDDQGNTYASLSGDDVKSKTKRKTVMSGKRGKEMSIRIRRGKLGQQTGMGKINRAAVQSVFRRRMSAIRICYEKALKVNPDVQGKITIRFTIGRAGTITDIKVTGNSTGDKSIGSCIIQKVRRWRFSPPDEGEVTFSYPFLLQRG